MTIEMDAFENSDSPFEILEKLKSASERDKNKWAYRLTTAMVSGSLFCLLIIP